MTPPTRWIPIPKQFHSLYHEGLFTNCVDCNRELLKGDCIYLIERVFIGTEPVAEIAICTACREKLACELSKDSSQRMKAFVEERFDVEMRLETVKDWGDDIEKRLKHCLLLKHPVNECRGYQISSVCRGDMLAVDVGPIAVSSVATEEMKKLMSKKTRDRLGEAMQDFFDMPPEFADGPAPMIW